MAIDYTLGVVALGASIIGFVAGCLGSFATLRRQSLLGDAIAHASLPGVAIAFLLTQSKDPLVLVIGAFIAGIIGTLFVILVTKKSKIKEDAALGIILSVFFGFGVFLLTLIQKLPSASKSGLDKFLFGNASSLLLDDVKVLIIIGACVLALLFLFWKEFKILTFDPDFAKSLGFPIRSLNILLLTLTVASIVIGLQTVGVVLMSALVIAPAIAARQWTDKLSVMVLLAGLCGAISGVLGSALSGSISDLPTGPTIVLVLSVLVFFSLFFSPHRGLVKDWIQRRRNKKKVQLARVFSLLYQLSESHRDKSYPHDISSLLAVEKSGVERALYELKQRGLASEPMPGKWALTQKGRSIAEKEGEINVS